MANDTGCEAPLDAPELLVVDPDDVHSARLWALAQRVAPSWPVIQLNCAKLAMRQLIAQAPRFQLALLGPSVAIGDGVAFVQLWRRRRPRQAVVMLMDRAQTPDVLALIRAGVNGCLLQNDPLDLLAGAVVQAQQGLFPISAALSLPLFKMAGSPLMSTAATSELTPKQHQTLRYLSQGYGYSLTAELMGIRLSTLQTHVRQLYRKLRVHSQTQAVARARQLGLLE